MTFYWHIRGRKIIMQTASHPIWLPRSNCTHMEFIPRPYSLGLTLFSSFFLFIVEMSGIENWALSVALSSPIPFPQKHRSSPTAFPPSLPLLSCRLPLYHWLPVKPLLPFPPLSPWSFPAPPDKTSFEHSCQWGHPMPFSIFYVWL